MNYCQENATSSQVKKIHLGNIDEYVDWGIRCKHQMIPSGDKIILRMAIRVRVSIMMLAMSLMMKISTLTRPLPRLASKQALPKQSFGKLRNHLWPDGENYQKYRYLVKLVWYPRPSDPSLTTTYAYVYKYIHTYIHIFRKLNPKCSEKSILIKLIRTRQKYNLPFP